MLISVIVPIYNTNIEYLKKCINSVINQTYKEFELLLIDDGSTIEVKNTCEIFSKYDKRIKVFHQQNKGVSVARNLGILKSKGDLITFVDSDDWIERNYLDFFISKYNNYKCNIISCDRMFEYKNKNKKSCFFSENTKFNQNNKKNLIYKTITTGVGGTWCKVYEKEFLLNNNLLYKEGLKRAQDIIFNLNAFQLSNSYMYIQESLYHYRMHEESVTKKYTPTADKDLTKTAQEFIKFVNKYYEHDTYINEALNIKILNILTEILRLKYFNIQNNKTWGSTKMELDNLINSSPFKEMKKDIKVNNLNSFGKLKVLLIKYNQYFLLKKLFKLEDIVKGIID